MTDQARSPRRPRARPRTPPRARWGATRRRAQGRSIPTTSQLHPGCRGDRFRPLVVTASSGSTTYGNGPPAITPSYSGFVNGDNANSLPTPPTCSTTATSASPVASYPTTCSGAGDPNYSITYQNGSVAVTPAPVTITASSGMAGYGGTPPAVKPIVTGLENGETASVLGGGLTCSTFATASSPVGTYATTCSGAVDCNYAISYVGGTTTVIPAPLTITATSGTMTYGGAVPVISPNVSGLQNGRTYRCSAPD